MRQSDILNKESYHRLAAHAVFMYSIMFWSKSRLFCCAGNNPDGLWFYTERNRYVPDCAVH
jgi:hypothetical protein